MEVLEVEVQRFGSKYIGYVSPDPLILNPKDRYPEPKIVRSNQDLLESTMYSNIWGHSTIGSIISLQKAQSSLVPFLLLNHTWKGTTYAQRKI